MKKPDLLEDPVKGLFLKYLAPSVSATLVTSIYILADTLMIGRGVGPVGIAALNLMLPVFSLFFGTGMLFGVGGGVLLSVSLGRGDKKGAGEYFTAALILAVTMSLFYVVAGHLLFNPVTKFLGSGGAMVPYVEEYGRIMVTGAPAFLLSAFLQAFVRNDRAPKLSMAAVVAGGVTNVVLDYVFIFPLGMGMAGACIASVIGTCLTCVILLIYVFSPGSTLKISFGVKPHMAGQVVVNGFASFLLEMCNGVVIFLFNRQLIAYVGELGVVVYGIISNSALIVASVSNGISQAAQPIMAMNFGAGNKKRIKQVRHMGEGTMVVSGLLFAGVGFFAPGLVTAAFVKPTPEILGMSVPAVRIYFIAFLAMGFNIFYGTCFQSVMKAGYSMVICMMRGLVVSGILVFLLPIWFGVDGIWAVMPVTEFFVLFICRILMAREGQSFRESTA